MIIKTPVYEELHTLNAGELDQLFIATFKSHPDFIKLNQALDFAKVAHGRQKRKLFNAPYYVHMIRIALTMYLDFKISDVDMLVAAILHDTIEDTAITYKDLKQHFSTNIANMVLSLTKDPNTGNSQEHKWQEHVARFEKLADADAKVRLLKFFDIYDNVHSYDQVKPTDECYQDLPRWMKQFKELYLPFAQNLGNKYYQLLKAQYDKFIDLGIDKSSK